MGQSVVAATAFCLTLTNMTMNNELPDSERTRCEVWTR